MKTITEYIQKKHIIDVNLTMFSVESVNFKYFCNLKTEDKYDVLGIQRKDIVDALNSSETSSDYNSNITLKFKDGYLHIGAYYEVSNMKIYTAYLFSENEEFPDKEWSDCDWRNAIDIKQDDATKLWILLKDMSMFADELIKHKIKK